MRDKMRVTIDHPGLSEALKSIAVDVVQSIWQAELRTQFSADLERTREQVAVAQERANAAELRAPREIDQERTLRQKGEQVVATCAPNWRLQAERDTLCLQSVDAQLALEDAQTQHAGPKPVLILTHTNAGVTALRLRMH
ncbi:hypothetical protein [Cupriavidus sp. IDO]|uniref:hypothetical protein n=1 Tax=Cupriavidus sp. IDO TaxID=1539142 RepID=UPI0005799B4D|nr:hypothetical protein RM96_21145 [Cupriavidus sp. IDO]